MAKILDTINNTYLVKLTFSEYEIFNSIWLFDSDENDDEKNFDDAIKSYKVKEKLSILSSKV